MAEDLRPSSSDDVAGLRLGCQLRRQASALRIVRAWLTLMVKLRQRGRRGGLLERSQVLQLAPQEVSEGDVGQYLAESYTAWLHYGYMKTNLTREIPTNPLKSFAYQTELKPETFG